MNAIFTLSILLTILFSCGQFKKAFNKEPLFSNSQELIDFNSPNVINVKNCGAKGNGYSDDRAAIQSAFKKNQTVYFPAGKYLIKSYSAESKFLYITDANAPKEIIFHKDAKIIISPDQNPKYLKSPLFFIDPLNKSIDTLKFIGLKVEGNSHLHSYQNTAISVYVRKQKYLKNLIVENCHLMNMGNQGIHTKAKNSFLKNIITENTSMHGISASNKTDPNYKMYVSIENYTSLNDKAYSIDLGKQMDFNSKLAKTGFQWDAEIKNVKSINSNLGIKTAGKWDAKFENILIENPTHNGFYVNHDSPDHTIQMDKIKIINSGGNGLVLSKKTKFTGNNIQIINCKGGALYIDETDAQIDSLFIDGNYRSKYLMRFGNTNTFISNFKIQNNSAVDPHPIWIKANSLTLSNGILKNITSEYPVILHENSKNVTLLNINVEDNIGNKINKLHILNLQKNNSYKIKSTSYKMMFKNK